MLEKNKHHSGPIREIRTTILQLLPNGYPKLSVVANLVGISRRTLQRRLMMIGTTYTNLVNELRFDLADELLQNDEMKISKIATELGFVNHSGFCRAFRGWSGMTPRQYRSRMQKG